MHLHNRIARVRAGKARHSLRSIPFSIRTPSPGILRNMEFTARFIFALSLFLTCPHPGLSSRDHWIRMVSGSQLQMLPTRTDKHHVYRWHPCSASWSRSRVCAACSRPSNAVRSSGVRFRSRLRFLPRLRASESSSSSLSRSRQLRTPFESSRIGHLLKTTNSKLPLWRTKSKQYFRLMFALLFSPVQAGTLLQYQHGG